MGVASRANVAQASSTLDVETDGWAASGSGRMCSPQSTRTEGGAWLPLISQHGTPDERPTHVALSYPAEDGTHWRSCDVDRDPRYGVIPVAVGLDFAAHSDPAPGWSGMNHHSQFKCMVFENEPVVGLPQQITPADAAVKGYRLNRCRAAGPAVDPVGINPAITDVACEPLATTAVRPGDVAWAAIPYVDYGTDAMRKSGKAYGLIHLSAFL